jgi:hypothetical protein
MANKGINASNNAAIIQRVIPFPDKPTSLGTGPMSSWGIA